MKKHKHLKYLLFSLSIIFIITITIILLKPHFKLTNPTGLVNEPYTPEIKVNNYFQDLSNNLTIKNNIDTKKIGKYNIYCELNYNFFKTRKTFQIMIVDKTSPQLELKGTNPAIVCPNKEYIEEGYIAIDNYDGNITNNVILEKHNDNITYSIIDSSKNKTTQERKIIYQDQEQPVITLNGSNTITLPLGSKYIEPGYIANDNCDGAITDQVKVSNPVNPNRAGTYQIKYEVTDSNNNTTIVERTIIIKSINPSNEEGTIYLTFDDGSSPITNEIVKILDEYNIKATFFVISVNDYTKIAYNHGHSIGLHSYTHNYSYIYASQDNYFNDLSQISNAVYNNLGLRTTIIRFPGGSSNTISRKYNVGIMTNLTREVLKRGYTYFDWNIDSNDAGSDVKNSQNIINNVITNLSLNRSNVVLMHDSKGHEATVEALKTIISYGKNNGYTFKAITKNTTSVTHRLNN